MTIPRWEYKLQQPTGDSHGAFEKAINEAGAEGWQLIESWEAVFPDADGPGKHRFTRVFVVGRPVVE